MEGDTILENQGKFSQPSPDQGPLKSTGGDVNVAEFHRELVLLTRLSP